MNNGSFVLKESLERVFQRAKIIMKNKMKNKKGKKENQVKVEDFDTFVTETWDDEDMSEDPDY